VVFVSAELPEEENYAPAEWKYFVGGAEVCREGFQKRLERTYAARRESRVDLRA
jgi:hypothetical protein